MFSPIKRDYTSTMGPAQTESSAQFNLGRSGKAAAAATSTVTTTATAAATAADSCSYFSPNGDNRQQEQRENKKRQCAAVCACVCVHVYVHTYICINQFVFFCTHFIILESASSPASALLVLVNLQLFYALLLPSQGRGRWRGGDCGVFSVLAGQTMARPLAHRLQLGVSLCVCVPFSWAWHSARDQ